MTGLPDVGYSPTLSAALAESRLARLIPSGTIGGNNLDRTLARLDERFRVYCATYPHGLWAPGLMVTPEMRRATELLLPMAEIRRAFRQFFSAALLAPSAAILPFLRATSWLDLLRELPSSFAEANPAAMLRKLLHDTAGRRQFLFALFLPASFGGGFGRYPLQASWLRGWLATGQQGTGGGIACLDAACGSGEGSYELLELLAERGFSAGNITLHATSLLPLEIHAAAHCSFCHDPQREALYRERVTPLFRKGMTAGMRFFPEDLTAVPANPCRYDLIVCNGLIGGPLLHDSTATATVIGRLAGRLRRGGVLLAANRFHPGWEKRIPAGILESQLEESGLELLDLPEGWGGIKRDRS